MQKVLIIGIIIISSIFDITYGLAQNSQNKWAIGLGSSLISYRPKPDMDRLEFSFLDVGAHLSLSRYLSSAFDFNTFFLVAPTVHFPTSENSFTEQTLFDMNYQMMFKLNNGGILRESAPIAPYVFLGIGGSYVNNNPDAYVPFGGGVKVRLGDKLALRIQTERKLSINKDFQHVAHSGTLVYQLGNKENKEKEWKPDKLREEYVDIYVQSTDTDGDGIVDLKDKCPEVAGFAYLDGCLPTDTIPQTYVDSPVDTFLQSEDSIRHPFPKEDIAITPIPSTTSTQEKAIQEEILITEKDPDTVASSPIVEAVKPEEEDTKTPFDPESEVSSSSEADSPCSASQQFSPIFFKSKDSEIPKSSFKVLDLIAEKLKNCQDLRLIIQGYANEFESEKENLTLSIMRAFTAKYYLVYQHGIKQVRITSGGTPESSNKNNSLSKNKSNSNRRIDFFFRPSEQ